MRVYEERGASAFDLCDPAAGVEIGGDAVDPSTPGTCVVSCEAIDASGNVSAMNRTVQVADSLPPAIHRNGPSELTLECPRDDYLEPGARVEDACDETAGEAVIGGDVVNLGAPGTYVITYGAVDGSGNRASAERRLHVVDTTPPRIQRPAATPDVLWPPNHEMVPVSLSASPRFINTALKRDRRGARSARREE